MEKKRRPRVGNIDMNFEQHGWIKRILDEPMRPVHLLKADLTAFLQKHRVSNLALNTRIEFARALARPVHIHMIWHTVLRQVFADHHKRKIFEMGLLHAASMEFQGDHLRAVRSSIKSALMIFKDPSRPTTKNVTPMPAWIRMPFLGESQAEILFRLGVGPMPTYAAAA